MQPTPTPADAPAASFLRPPYVHKAGEDDVGQTLRKLAPRAMTPTPAESNPFEEATRLSDEADASLLAHEGMFDSGVEQTRVADEPSGMGGDASGDDEEDTGVGAEVVARSHAHEDEGATRVADDPAALDPATPRVLVDLDEGPILDDSNPGLIASSRDRTDPGLTPPIEETNPGDRVKTTVKRVDPRRGGDDDDVDVETSPVEKIDPLDLPTGNARRPARPSAPPDDDFELAQAFDRSFSRDLSQLAPDGSTIESPVPLFSRLSHEAHSELKRRMSFRRCAAGDLVLREGDPGDACFVIHSGSVRVLKRDPSGSSSEVIEIARLGAGSLFGEFALLADRRRHASVQALEACELWEIPRRLLRELAAEYADVGPALEQFYRERLLSTLLATAPFFQPLPEEERAQLMSRFTPRRIEAGGPIIREGEPGGGLYLIVLGTVDITRRTDGRRAVLLATLGEGAYFGEMSLLSGGRASATVVAAGPVELAQLSPKDFYEVCSAHPIIWDELRKEAHRRELVNQDILAGDTRMV
jgi:CRP-like cAMP-binding protein